MSSFTPIPASSWSRRQGCRLLYIAGNLDTGGEERQLYNLLCTLDRERYQPAIAAWNFRAGDLHVGPLQELRVPIYSLAGRPTRIKKLFALRSLVSELKPEVVHSYSFYTNFAAYWATFGTTAIGVGSVRSAFPWAKKEAGPILGRLSAMLPLHQIINSMSAADQARSTWTFWVAKHLYVVRNGLDLQKFRPFDHPANVEAHIVGIGYLVPVKRWERLLVAAQELKGRGLQFQISIAGNGPLMPALLERAQYLGVLDRVRFLSHTDDVAKLLATASFVVHTAESEGYPNAVMEAMACGRAVVATKVGDIPHLVEDGVNGFVVAGDDPLLFADRMAVLINDRERCRRMGAIARRKAEREFGLDRLVAETLAAYQRAGWQLA